MDNVQPPSVGGKSYAQENAAITAQKQQTTVLGQITATFRKVIDAWGDLGKNASEWLSTSMNSGISTVSQGLTGLITKTGDWKQTFTNAIDSMLEGLIELGVKTVLHYALMGAMMLAHKMLGTSTTNATVAEQTAAGAAIASAHAPAAAATSISSYGVAAIVAEVLAIAAIAAIMALISGGFAEGGQIPGAPSHKDNRIAKVATGEFITRVAAVDYYGVELLRSINDMSFPLHLPGYADGGLVGGAVVMNAGSGGGGGKTINHINVAPPNVTLVQPNLRSEVLSVMRSAEGHVHILDAVAKGKHKLPFKQ